MPGGRRAARPLGKASAETARDIIFGAFVHRGREDLFGRAHLNQLAQQEESRFSEIRAACCTLWVTMTMV